MWLLCTFFEDQLSIRIPSPTFFLWTRSCPTRKHDAAVSTIRGLPVCVSDDEVLHGRFTIAAGQRDFSKRLRKAFVCEAGMWIPSGSGQRSRIATFHSVPLLLSTTQPSTGRCVMDVLWFELQDRTDNIEWRGRTQCSLLIEVNGKEHKIKTQTCAQSSQSLKVVNARWTAASKSVS